MSEPCYINDKLFDNVDSIVLRVNTADDADKGSLKTALMYLYVKDGPKNLHRAKMKSILKYLDPAERIVINWLQIRTNGNARKKYGHNSYFAAKDAKYKCITCGFSDVRALQLDHVNGRNDTGVFQCICANCHMIKSREKDWDGITSRKKPLTTLVLDEIVLQDNL